MIFKCCIDDALRAEDNANSTVNLQVSFFQTTENLQIFFYVKTTSTSQMKVYCGCGSLSLKIPVMHKFLGVCQFVPQKWNYDMGSFQPISPIGLSQGSSDFLQIFTITLYVWMEQILKFQNSKNFSLSIFIGFSKRQSFCEFLAFQKMRFLGLKDLKF